MTEHSVHDTAKVWLMSLFSFILSNAHLALGLALMGVNLGYTIWKWRRDYIKEKNASK